MEALKDATINDIKELAEAEKIREIGPLFENDQDLQAICEMIKVEFGCLVLFFPDVGNALVEQQRKHELLVIASVDQTAQQHGGTPEVAFEILLGYSCAHCSQPPSSITVANRVSASRQRVSASLKADNASGRGGMSSCKGGST